MSPADPVATTAGQGVELYVYYQVLAASLDTSLAVMRARQAALRSQWPCLDTRLLARDDARDDGPHTWMEIYRAPLGLTPEMVDAVCSQLVDAPPGRIGPRHTERFTAFCAC